MTIEISLSNSSLQFAVVDAIDVDKVIKLNWTLHPDGYAYAWHHGESVSMHRFLLGWPAGSVDYKDQNKLNNSRINLRTCTQSQNLANQPKNRVSKSIYKGVTFEKQTQKWRAQIKVKGKHFGLGRFRNEVEAAKAYDIAALQYFGKFANPNFK